MTVTVGNPKDHTYNCKMGKYCTCKLSSVLIMQSSDQPFIVSHVLIGLARQVLFSYSWCHAILSSLARDDVSTWQAVFSQLISACLIYCSQKHILATKWLTLPSVISSIDLERYMEILWQNCILSVSHITLHLVSEVG